MPQPPMFGVFVPQGWRMDLVKIKDPVEQYAAMTRAGQEAERLGFDSIWLYDHFHTVPRPTQETTFECWASMAGLARDTQTIRLGQMCTCDAYRNPAYLAKFASTVDVMSNGRLDLGIGAGWYEHEWRAYGYGFPDGPTRLKMLRDGLQIIKAMWTEDEATVEGRYYQVKGAINRPKPVQKPYPPIWVAGSGEKVTLKLVAQYGDASNFGAMDLDDFRHKCDVLRGHCETVGRDYDTIVKSTNLNVLLLEPRDADRADELSAPYRGGQPLEEWSKGNFVGTPSDLVSLLSRMQDAGAQYFIMYVYDLAYNLAPLQMLASEVVNVMRA